VHWDGGQAMRKLTECLMVVAFLLCAFTAQAASGIDVSIPSAVEPCSNDLDCTLGGACINDICVPSVGDPCSNDLDCGPNGSCVNDICVLSTSEPCTNDLQCGPGELCIDDVCQEAECETSEDCEEGLVCDNTTSTCVECLTNADCEEGFCDSTTTTCVECLQWTDCSGEGEICADNNTCVQADDCDLKITPKRVKINRNSKLDYKAFKLTVKGNENFYPFRVDPETGEPIINPSSGKPFRDMTLTPFEIKATSYRWRQKNRMLEEVLGLNNDEDSGFYTLRFGNCLVDIEVQNKADAKKK